MKKGFAPLIILIVGLIIGTAAATAYFKFAKQPQQQTIPAENRQITYSPSPAMTSTTPTPDPTANWKRYANTKVGFQIKFPLSFSKPQIPGGVGPNPVYADGTESDVEVLFNGPTTAYGFTVFPFSGTLDDLLAERKIRYAKPDLKIPVIFPDIPVRLEKTITVDNVKANLYSDGYENGTSSSNKEVIFIGKNYGFIFRADGNAKTVDTQEMEDILSTFKFTQ